MRQIIAITALSLLLTSCIHSPASSTVSIDISTPEPIPSAPSAGDTWIRPADGMTMVYVPAGEFLMGSTDADSEADKDEKPQRSVYVDGFWVDKTEVTNAQYRECVEAGACRETWCQQDNELNAPDQPVVCVFWNGAREYAAWVGGRLPTEAEWEKAARGTDGRKYPWGNSAPDCDKANYQDCVGSVIAVGSYPAGASPYGILDMAGNVWEWTADKYDERYYSYSPARNPQGADSGGYRVMRGGAFLGNVSDIRCASRYKGNPKQRPRWYGFRVVVDFDTTKPETFLGLLTLPTEGGVTCAS